MIKYTTEDGKVFDTKVEAVKHESELAAAKKKERELKEKKEARAKEVEDAYKKYVDLSNAYKEDYGEFFTLKRSYDNWADFAKDFWSF